MFQRKEASYKEKLSSHLFCFIKWNKFMRKMGENTMYHHSYRYQMNPSVRAQKGEIHVTGEGSVSLQPTIANVWVGVETEDVELSKAQKKNSSHISQIIQALTEMGIPKEFIQTTSFTIYPMYDFVDGKQTFRGYRVEHMLQVTIQDLDRVGAVVDTAVQHGANRVSNISFHFAHPTKAYQVALQKAVQNAIEKADTIAHSLQVHLDKTPIKITEEFKFSEGPQPFVDSPMVKSASTMQIEPGKQEIKARISAVFLTNISY